MKKITTLFKKDPNDLGRVINQVNPENQWVFDEPGRPTRKFDGTACAIINGELYKRYDVKKGKLVPDGAIPCQDPDSITGHWPHWVKCDRKNPEDKFHFEAFNLDGNRLADGTYELCGPKIQGNPEGFDKHYLLEHGMGKIALSDFSFESIKAFFENPKNDMEGIVFHGFAGKMCKIRKSDFGIKR